MRVDVNAILNLPVPNKLGADCQHLKPSSGAPVSPESAKVTQALLAGRKLLLADDSITIQKVVALTFADEGVEVLSVSNGRDAIDQLAQFQPDIALVDVFMPQVSGYEVCEYIKQNEQLRHIPVMLLVGSFEPFDEAEARRVGADDTLTKPFQSIRNLIDKVGSLVSARPAEEQIPTAELPQPDVEESRHEPEPELLSEDEINIVTADTQPLPIEMRHMVEASAARSESAEGVVPESQTRVNEGQLETQTTEAGGAGSEPSGDVRAEDSLLDLGGLGRETSSASEEFVLDLDLDEAPDDSAYQPSAYVRAPVYKSPARDWKTSAAGPSANVATVDQLARTQEFPASLSEAARESRAEAKEVAEPRPMPAATTAGAQGVSLEGVSPEVIDAIARRAVEHLSEKVVREIAWEVVPDLAELLIKRQLEENKS
jgi:CheY-like chemotaxis protein